MMMPSKILLPVNCNDNTCTITEAASKTNKPPTIANTISSLIITLIIPKAAPVDKEPVSPINTLAGGALNQKPIPALQG